MVQIGYAIFWWLILLIVGLITFPLVSRICGRFQDKGYAIAKPLGLLILAYFSWIFPSIKLIKFGYTDVFVSLMLLLVVSLLFGRKHLNWKEMPWKSIFITEAVFAVAFGVFLFIISHKSDFNVLWSEDFMDFGFLNSILRSDYFPPTDPWAAGRSIPYYYGGHVITAVLIIITRIPPQIAYNLAVAMFFSLAVIGAYGLGCNILKGRISGFITVLFVCITGFISGVFQLGAFFLGRSVEGYSPTVGPEGYTQVVWPHVAQWFLSFDFVTANRIIPEVVNHYPYYAYMVGDLHANIMDIPYQLMFVALVFACLDMGGDPVRSCSRSDMILRVLILSLSLGFLMFVNSWSYPVYMGFGVLAILLLKNDLGKKIVSKLIALIALIGLSALIFLPYYLDRGGDTKPKLGVVDERTTLAPFSEIFALFLVAIFSFICVLLLHRYQDRHRHMLSSLQTQQLKGFYIRSLWKYWPLAMVIVITIATVLIAFLLDFQLLLLIVPMILAPLFYILRSHLKQETKLVLILVISGAFVLFFFEIFFIDDPLSAPAERYNSLLKIYMAIWIVWGIASSYAVVYVFRRLRGQIRLGWGFVLIILTIAVLIHPIATTTSWASGRYSHVEGDRLTLDGLEYLKTDKPWDYGAIQWLRENVKGSHVILEAPGEALKYSSQASALTGLPTLLGWEGWEVMWRDTWDLSTERVPAINTIYQNPGSEEAKAYLKDFNVEYIYIGVMEKDRYGIETLEKFASQTERYEMVYQNEGVTIYKVIL